MPGREATLNDQGRLNIPKDLCGKEGLERKTEVVLVGCGDHFEIWNKANLDTALEVRELDRDELRIM